MTTQLAPLLTSEMCGEIAIDNSTESGRTAYWAVRAIEDGRTVCVRVMSEDECRAEFDQVFGVHDETEYKRHIRLIKIQTWIASRRAMGAVR